MAKTINQVVFFDTTPATVYNALMDSKTHGEFTNTKAEISQDVGGAFSTYDGYITGTNVELVPNEKIVQSWHASDWKEDEISTVTYELEEVEGKTKLTFTHADVPDEKCDDIEKGWEDYYWKPMRELFAKN